MATFYTLCWTILQMYLVAFGLYVLCWVVCAKHARRSSPRAALQKTEETIPLVEVKNV